MSIFDIEEKSNNKVDEDYLISNGWKLAYVGSGNWVYIKIIHHKNKSKRFIKFCYHLDTLPKRTLRNMNTWETIEAHDIMTFELQIKEWITNWENIVYKYFI